MSNKIKAFNLVAEIYDNWYEHLQGKQVFKAEMKAIKQIIPNGIGVEIGAGTGIFAENLSSDDRVILCLDPSTEMLSRARDRGLSCILGLGELLPIRVGLLDFCYMVTVIEFIDKPVVMFGEIWKVSKQNAPISILFINSESSWGEFYRFIGGKGDRVFRYANLYTLDEVLALLYESGYNVLCAKGTLNSDPMDQRVDNELVEPSEQSGVLIVKAVKMG